MAKKTIIVSDLTDNEVADEDLAIVKITLAARPNDVFTLEVSSAEISELLESAMITTKRGRPKK